MAGEPPKANDIPGDRPCPKCGSRAEARVRFLERREIVDSCVSDDKMDWPLSVLETGVRLQNMFYDLKMRTMGDLVRLSRAEFLKTKGVGYTSLRQIKEELQKYGLALGMTIEQKTARPLCNGASRCSLECPVGEHLHITCRRCRYRSWQHCLDRGDGRAER